MMNPEKAKKINQIFNDASAMGLGCTNLAESIPKFNVAECEKVISGNNNTFIVLGRDRPTTKISGYGGKGVDGSGMIDIVVGRVSPVPKEVNEDGEDLKTDNSPSLDAARLTLSQRSDVDENFNLAKGSVGNSVNKSSAVLKADSTRIIGRHGIKIITGTDPIDSKGKQIIKISGIDLIAGNDGGRLQPLVKGNNLSQGLQEIIEEINKLGSIISNLIKTQMQLAVAFGAHVHAIPGTPSPIAAVAAVQAGIEYSTQLLDGLASQVNLETVKSNYFKPYGARYINSRWNKTN